MIRLRMAGGRLTKDKLLYIAQSIEKYHVKKAHLTTCQTIQLHDLDADAVCGIMEGAMEHGSLPWAEGEIFRGMLWLRLCLEPREGSVLTCFPMPRRRKNFSCPSWTRRRCQES